MYIREEQVNVTEGYRCGDSQVYEAWMNTPGEAYKEARRLHGRCTGKVYVDPDCQHVGWVFLKLERYEDTGGPYLCETWVTLHEAPPTKTVTYHYVDMVS